MNLLEITRRHFFEQCGVGVGKIALAGLLADALGRAAPARGGLIQEAPLSVRTPHFPG